MKSTFVRYFVKRTFAKLKNNKNKDSFGAHKRNASKLKCRNFLSFSNRIRGQTENDLINKKLKVVKILDTELK